MNSLKQYIDFYHENEHIIRQGVPEAVNAPRRHALSTLEHGTLPRKSNEYYAVTDVDAMFAPDLAINPGNMAFKPDQNALKCGVPNISTLLATVVNDTYYPSSTLERNLPEGVTVCTFAQAETLVPGVLAEYYGRIADPENVAAALNTLLVHNGILVHVAKGLQCEKPLQLVNMLGGVNVPMLNTPRVLVVVEDGASLRMLVCNHSRSALAAHSVSDVTELHVGVNAALEYYVMEESADTTRRMAAVYADLDADARLVINSTTLHCGETRNNFLVNLNAPGADAQLSGMAITDGRQVADNATRIRHNAPHCTSNQLFKYVVDGESTGGFEGLIRIAEGADHTEAYQTNRNMVASQGARMHTCPQLEIYCDDVRANHGAATGQLDERALFYMRSRGIPEAEARTMLMQAFMADVIDTVKIDPLRDRLRHLVDQRLGGALECQTCALQG